RRHTRFSRDWSSDVCPSDLYSKVGMGNTELFEREVERLRASGALGRTGRLRELFDFLANQGPARPVSQADIAHEVFGQLDAGARSEERRVGNECRRGCGPQD